jgi:hypothetical protein
LIRLDFPSTASDDEACLGTGLLLFQKTADALQIVQLRRRQPAIP